MVISAVRQTVYLLFFLVIGFACNKSGFLDKEKCKGLSNLLIYVFTPALIIVKLQLEPTPERVRGLAFAAAMSILAFGIAIAISHFLFRKNTEINRVSKFSGVYANCAYMGVPLVEGVLGTSSVFYLVVLVGIFNIFAFTHGVTVMRHEEDKISWKSIALCPAILAVVLGVILFLGGVTLPNMVSSPLQALADCMSPVSMFVAGNSFASVDFYKDTSWPSIAKALAVRLLLVPMVIGLVFAVIPGSIAPKLAIFIGMSCPTAALTVAYSLKYDRDDGFASQILSFSTTLSILTLPMMVWFGNLLIK